MSEPAIVCPNCGTANVPPARFCEECGAPLPDQASSPDSSRPAEAEQPLLGPPPETSDRREPPAGNWFATAPPSSILLLGAVVLLGSCLLLIAGRVDPTDTLMMVAICVGPIGLAVLIVGLVRLLRKRPARRL